jgi:uncharacterized DUF497 family protein
MDFDWLDVSFDLKKVPPREVEESFEDPFCLRLLPDADRPGTQNRYYNLGKTVANRPLFSVFWTDGKKYRVVASREMTQEESAFYERKNNEFL